MNTCWIFPTAILLMSLTGLAFFRLSNTIVTPFHFFSIVVLFGGMVNLFHSREKFIKRLQKKLIYFFIFLLIVGFLSGDSAFSFSYLHSYFYIAVVYSLLQLCQNNIQSFIKINSTVIILYFMNVLGCVFLNIFQIHISFLDSIFQQGIVLERYRIWAFSSEPSYLALTITASMFGLCKFKNNFMKKSNFNLLFFVYFATILLARTSAGFLCVALILWFWLSQRSLSCFFLFLSFCVGIILGCLGFFALRNNISFIRLYDIAILLGQSSDLRSFLTEVKNIDSSIYYRIGPLFLYVEQLDWGNLYTWIGHGFLTSRDFFTNLIWGDFSVDDRQLSLPFFPGALYSLGIIGILFPLLIVWGVAKGKHLSIKFFILLVLINSNISTMILWYVIIIFAWMTHIENYNIKIQKQTIISTEENETIDNKTYKLD